MSHNRQRFELLEEVANITRKIRILFDMRVREVGLTSARARTLLRIARSESANQKELADELEIEAATLVRLIDGLEEQGLIERRGVEGDRRAKQVVLAPAGAALVKRVDRMAIQVGIDVLAGIPETELAGALTIARRIAGNVEIAASNLGGNRPAGEPL